jgi:hypothetical protein
MQHENDSSGSREYQHSHESLGYVISGKVHSGYNILSIALYVDVFDSLRRLSY